MMHFTGSNLVRKLVAMSTLAVCAFAAQATFAQCLQQEPLRGVNMAGAEFHSNHVPGVPNKDYAYPNPVDFDYIRSIGGNVIRLPFRWERVQPELMKPLDPEQLKALKSTVEQASRRNLCVILDVHNYATYRGKKLGSDEVPAEAFEDLWKRLAHEFDNPARTILGLMNEPAKIDMAQWAAIAKRTVASLRDDGAKNIILVAGGRWSGAHEWTRGSPSNGELFADLKDPLQRTWLEAHQYADHGFAGIKQQCVAPERLQRVFARLTDWARENHQKLFLGEFGVAANDECLAALDAMLAGVDDAEVWRGWTYWAMGRWWNKYPMSIQPQDGRDAPQTAVLRKYLAPQRHN
jgi:endoglucanase